MRLNLFLDGFDDSLDFFIGYERTLETLRLAGALRDEQRVAHTDELLCTRLVEDDARVRQRGRGEGQP